MTIHCGDNYLLQLRRNFTVRLERCRLVGFDMGAGGSKAFAGDAGAVLVSACRIEAGFGKSPGFGNLFDVRGALVVRVEDSVIRGPFRSVWDGGGGAAQLFERTRFELMDPRWPTQFESPPRGVRLKECTQEFAEPEAYRQAERAKPRSLAEINPAWVEPKRR
jgi:hypothetical protein